MIIIDTLLIKNAHIVSPSDGLDNVADVLVKDGKIAEIAENISFDGNVIDADGLTLIPGLVDMHVHLRDPGQTQKEDIITGCSCRRRYKPACNAKHNSYYRQCRNS